MAGSHQDSEQVKAQHADQKEFPDPATTALAGTFGWFALKAIVQAIIGWMGLRLFQRIINWFKRKKNKNDKGASTEISAEESAAAS